MANRRCFQTLKRHYYSSLLSSNHPSLQSLKSLPQIHQTLTLTLPIPNPNPNPLISTQTPKFHLISTNLIPNHYSQRSPNRHFCSHRSDDSDNDDDDDDDDDDEAEYSDGESVLASNRSSKKAYTPEEKEKEAAGIGYKVVGPLDRADRVFKPYEPAFAVVQIGSHQFKVSNGDCIFTERLKFCEVNDKLILNKVLMVGSKTQTIIGRPILPDAAVIAVVEEHALDAKVIIFKKKRRKNYRRTKGHRQELTKLRITDIQGVEKPEETTTGKTKKANVKEPEKVAVAA